MDIVYTLGTGSKWDNNEIRYSLRSVEKFVVVDNVWIVGEMPGFLKNVKHIAVKESSGESYFKALRIYSKILKACQDPEVSEDFIYMADDHFWLKQMDRIPYYHFGDLMHSWERASSQSYQHTLVNTYNALIFKVLPTVNFNLHYPIVYNRKKFIDTIPKFKWGMYHGYAIKSLYCNSNGIEGEPGVECKIRNVQSIEALREMTAGKELFSIGDDALTDTMKQFLQELYPEKSRWEI